MPDDKSSSDYPYADEVVETLEEAKASKSRLEQLFTKPSKVAIVDVLLATQGKALTVGEIVEASNEISTASFSRYRDELIEDGVMERRGKRGNASLYALDTNSPVAQTLKMLENVLGFGKTPLLLDEEYIGEPGEDYEFDG